MSVAPDQVRDANRNREWALFLRSGAQLEI